MPHVDEGQLHAYLDRGPGDATVSEWATFESHLALCEDCQAKLEEARRIRDRAHEILAGVGPAEIEVPPFESLLAQSAGKGRGETSGGSAAPPTASRKRGWRSGNFPLAWAATIMVAVGAGWMARQVTMSSTEFGSLAKRPAAEVLESAQTPAAPGETRTAVAEQESLDRLEAKVDDELAVGRANETGFANNQELPSDRAAGLADAADQRAAAKSVVVTEGEVAEAVTGERARRQIAAEDPRVRAEAQRRDGEDEEAAREPSPLVARDIVGQADVDNYRNGPATGHAALGCYALEVEWSQTNAPPLPDRVRLLAAAATPPPAGAEYFRDDGAGRFYELNTDPASTAEVPYWLPFAVDSVLIVFPGNAGVMELRLQVADGELSGVAQAVAPALAGADEAAAEADAALGAPPAAARGSVLGRGLDCSGMD